MIGTMGRKGTIQKREKSSKRVLPELKKRPNWPIKMDPPKLQKLSHFVLFRPKNCPVLSQFVSNCPLLSQLSRLQDHPGVDLFQHFIDVN